MSPYFPRTIDGELDVLCKELPAIAIEGPRAVGKTESAARRAGTIFRLDDEQVLDVVRAQPSRLASGTPLILVDEWQRMPSSWDVVRRAVDADPWTPRFLLTGSAAPARTPAHTGAGRIVNLRMRPMSLAERSLCEPTVSLETLLGGAKPELEGRSPVRLPQYVDEITSSGFPALQGRSTRACRAFLNGYIKQICERRVDELGVPGRDRTNLRRFLAAYAAATSTTATFKTIRAAATQSDGTMLSRESANAYRAALEGLWIVEDVPAWLPTRNHLRRVAAAASRQLADPALAARLLAMTSESLLQARRAPFEIPRDGSLLGALFHSLVTLSVRVYAQSVEAKVFHLRTHGGEHEIDLIVQGADGRIVALEVKLAPEVSDRDLRHIKWLADTIPPELADAAVITTGREAYRRRDGVGVIPAALLSV